PRRTGEQVDARSLGDQVVELGLAGDRRLRVLAFGIAGARLLEAPEAEVLIARGLDDLVEQVVDGLVARRRDADAPAATHQLHGDPRPRPGLAGARRSLDEEVAAVERRGQLAQLVEVGRLDRRAWRGEARPGSRQDVGQRRIATVAGNYRAREAGKRSSLLGGVVRPPRGEASGRRDCRPAR